MYMLKKTLQSLALSLPYYSAKLQFLTELLGTVTVGKCSLCRNSHWFVSVHKNEVVSLHASGCK